MDKDPINPSHYKNSPAKCACGRPIECIDVTQHMCFTIGNTVKYLWRFRDKGGLEDLKKARWYLDHHIRMLEGETVDTNEHNDFYTKAGLIPCS